MGDSRQRERRRDKEREGEDRRGERKQQNTSEPSKYLMFKSPPPNVGG